MNKSLGALLGLLLLAGCGSSAAPSTSAPPAESQPASSAPTSPEPSESALPETFTMPDLVGKNLQKAQDELQSLGSYLLDQQDASGEGRLQINDKNWKVCSQQPDAGTEVPITATVVLASVKEDEQCPGDQPAEPEDEAAEPEAETFDNGDHIVGVDIQPGIYRAEVETGIIELCTVSQSDAKGEIMDIRNANEGSVIFTVVKKKDSVASFSGCGLIALAKDVLRKNPQEITNGHWLVGPELAPGKYQGVVDKDSAIRLGTIVQYNAKGKVMNIRNANSGKVVFTVKKSKDSVVSFSGFSEVKKAG